ncbi:hypothetical protein ANO14919_013590 [Xylariales sp. No.14919]|nr:hypothetical protein ANO14919_013590 [Xylariales sp. No.14919]
MIGTTGCIYNDTDGVQVVEQIIRQTLGVQTGSQRVGSGSETVVVDLPDGSEQEDGTRLEGSLHVVDEDIVVLIVLGATGSSSYTRLANIPKARSADLLEAAVCEDVAKNLEDVAQVRTSWRLLDQTRVEIPQQGRQHQIQDSGNQVSGPVADELGEIGRGDTKDGADVDEEIKPQHDAVDGLLGVNNDLLAFGVGDDVRLLVRALVDQRRGNVGLELRRADGQKIQGEGKGAEGITGLED